MKRILLILVFVFFSVGANSQVLIALLLGDKLNSGKIQFGLEGGYSFSTITGFESNNFEGNFNIGFYFLFKLKEQWYLNTGVLVKSTLGNDKLTKNDLESLGIESYTLEGRYSQRSAYFLVPALAQYQFKNHVYVEAGPQFGLLRKGWVEFNYNEDDYEGTLKKYNTDMMNRLDAGIVAGAGFRLLKGLGWTVGAKYYYGFVNVYKGKPGTKNSAIFLKMNVPIGLSDEQKGEIKKAKAAKQEKKESTEKYQLKQEKKKQKQIAKDAKKAEMAENK
jgi:hypothetical protein